MEKIELVKSYRKTRAAIQTFPFIYTAVLLAVSPLEAWLSLRWAELIGLLFFTSVPSVCLLWRLSLTLWLCRWHRAQCLAMLLPLSIPLCRIFWPDAGAVWVWGAVTVILMASLVNAYFVFVKPKARD